MVQLVHVSVSYSPAGGNVLDDISFSISKGETAALIGANGAGKTSLFLAISGILPLAKGSVYVDGIELSKRTLKTIRRKLGFVFQNPDDQLFTARIYDDILFGLLNMGLSEDDAKLRIRETLDSLGIAHLAERSPFRLSGGEKRLCAMATVLAMKPEILLFDEPTAFLDPRSQRNVSAVINALPHTKIIATHDLAFARALCNRALILRSGSLAADGNPTALFADPDKMTEWGF
jgi:cobalt/nickel transport system ATP-binding protein